MVSQAQRIRQQRIQEQKEKQRAIHKLKQRQGDEHVSEEDIQEALAHSRLERLSNMLPVSKAMPGHQPSGDNYRAAFRRLPYTPMKKHVHWLAMSQQDSSSDLTLTEEIQKFAEYVALDQAEVDARRNLLSDLKEAILVKWPAAQVTTFGSYSAGLSIFMSDLDVSILNVGIEHSASNGNLLATAADMVTSQETGDTGDGDEENGEENGEEDGTEGEGTADDQEIGDEEAGGAEEDGEDWEDMDEEEDTGSGEEDQEGDGMEGEDQEEDEEFGEVTWAIDTKPCTHTPRCPPTGCLPHLLPAAPAPAPAPVSTPPRAQTPTEGIDDDESDFFITTTVSRISPKRSASAADLDLDQDIEDSSSSEEEDKTAAIVHMALNSAPLNQHIHYDESCPAEPLEAPLMGSANSKPRRRSRQKIEEDLDVQILAPPEMLGSAGTNSNRLMQLVQLPPDTFTNSFLIDDDDQLLMGKTGRAGGDLDAAKHRKQQQMLRTLFAFIRTLGWVKRVELRARARVPIINLTHISSIQGDISLGLAAKDTSEVVQALVNTCPAVIPLSAFLKVYLAQLQLDKPFTGGLGSFKLYLLLAKHIARYGRGKEIDMTNLGLLLLSFLQYYGSPDHLSESTVVQMGGTIVSFDKTSLLPAVVDAFQRAYQILTARCRAGPTGHHHQVSSSFLAPLLDTGRLSVERSATRLTCGTYPLRTEMDKNSVALEILRDMLKGAPGADALLEGAKVKQPMLYAKLRSYYSAKALQGNKNHVQAKPKPVMPVSSHFITHGVVGRDYMHGASNSKKVPKKGPHKAVPVYPVHAHGAHAHAAHAPNARKKARKATPTHSPAVDRGERGSSMGYVASSSSQQGETQLERANNQHKLSEKMTAISSTINALKMKLQAKAREKNTKYL